MNKGRGRSAAINGQYGEETVEALMTASGFPVVDYVHYDGSTPVSVRQYPMPHPYRPDDPRSGKNDFMMFSGVVKVYCQVKNQNCSGTCDEKLSFAFDIARYGLMDDPYDLFALILMGTWWRDNPNIVEWAWKKCQEFEMLANGMRSKVKAVVIVGPIELSSWLRNIKVVRETNGLFPKH
jgi:hypothetical protein